MANHQQVLSWLHFGDLHITSADQPNHRDLQALIAIANRHLARGVDFALLPGDNADQGTAAQFRLVRDAIDRLRMQVRILPGDHDFHSRTLDAFHAVLGAEPLPNASTVAGYRCLFLDVVSAGSGGPDFRLGAAQLDWLEAELDGATRAGETAAIFMHTYPADLREGGERLRDLLARHGVACVDMGHTHYNELANDGRIIFMATRSTGQIEEGPVGFSVAAIDAGVVSWRFQPLDAAWPLVLVTSPADHRLITDPASADQLPRDRVRIAAKVWGERPIERASATLAGGAPIPLARDAADATRWVGATDAPDGTHRLTVRAQDTAGQCGEESIVVLVSRDGHHEPAPRRSDGSDHDRVGAWPKKHLLATQLGPNRNGRKW